MGGIMKLVLFVAFFLFTLNVNAARPSFWTMTCNDADRLVARHPGVVVNHGYSKKAGYLYSKYFPNTIHCNPRRGNPGYKKAVVKTLDNDRCDVGYTCSNGYSGDY